MGNNDDWLVDRLLKACWASNLSYEEYLSWHEAYCGSTPVTELEYAKACVDLDNEL